MYNCKIPSLVLCQVDTTPNDLCAFSVELYREAEFIDLHRDAMHDAGVCC